MIIAVRNVRYLFTAFLAVVVLIMTRLVLDIFGASRNVQELSPSDLNFISFYITVPLLGIIFLTYVVERIVRKNQ